jgi:hypothetical protein
MQIVLDIPQDVVWSIEQYIATQIRVTNDPVTGAQVMTKLYPTPDAFIEDAVHQTIHQVVKQYPPPSLRAQLEAAQKIEKEIKDMARPKRVGGTPPAPAPPAQTPPAPTPPAPTPPAPTPPPQLPVTPQG